MRYTVRLAVILQLICTVSLRSSDPVSTRTNTGEAAVSVLIIYDNYQGSVGLPLAWGFACLVDYQGRQLLFDTGNDADLYQKNMEQLGISPEEIPGLFISHGHWDHTAGIPRVTATNPSIRCYLPARYAEQLETTGNLPPNSERIFKSTHLDGPFYSTGDDFAGFREQGLVIKTPEGGILITGCSHPGVVEMVAKAREELGIEVHTVIGGLHLLQHTDEQVRTISAELKQLGIRNICATHCTGDNAIAILGQEFGTGYLAGGAGTLIMIDP